MKISLKNKELELTNIDELTTLLKNLETYEEVCISGFGSTSMIILLNNNYAFLSYFRYDGDHGFISINSLKRSESYQEFKLGNGQIDKYPNNILVDRQIGIEAIKYYFETEHMNPEIDWISQSNWTVI